MKNPYLLKRSPSSNLRTLLLGRTSSDRRNANELRKKPSTSFLFLSFFSFSFLFIIFSLSFLLSLSLLSSLALFLSCSPLLFLRTYHIFRHVHSHACGHMACHVSHMHLALPCLMTHGLPCVTHMAYHVSPDTHLEKCEILTFSEFKEIRMDN